MKKTLNKKSKFATFIIIVLIFALVLFIDDLRPITLDEELEFCGVESRNSIDFISENYEFKGREYFVCTVLNEGAASDGGDQYAVLNGTIKGLRNNRYDIFSYWEIEDEALTSQEYGYVSNYPDSTKKRGNKYIGIYAGFVPKTCTGVEIDGNQAEMVKLDFDLNGESVDCYFYYSFVEADTDYITAYVVVSDENGKSYSVENVEGDDGLERPVLTEI